jgi:hypothetical protein
MMNLNDSFWLKWKSVQWKTPVHSAQYSLQQLREELNQDFVSFPMDYLEQFSVNKNTKIKLVINVKEKGN